jgi:serine/threonine protein kinase
VDVGVTRPGDDALDDAFAASDDVLPEHVFAATRAPRPASGPRALLAGLVAAAMRSGRRRNAARRVAADPDLPAPGAVIGKYRIDEPVGLGGFAVVYRATHLVLQMPVAMKLLQPAMLRRHPHIAQTLWKEARYAARVNHPGVARVYDAHHSSRTGYVVMEYIDGCTLADVMAPRTPLPAAALLAVARDVVAGLSASLQQGLVHRDIKPSNILLTRGGEAKIVDLGLAHLHEEPVSASERVAARAIVGTPGYMAPEQVYKPDLVDQRADIYALGSTLYEAAVGQLPFAPGDRARWFQLQASEPVPVPHELVPDLPPRFGQLLLWMLARSPGHRPRDYPALLQALDGLGDLEARGTR